MIDVEVGAEVEIVDGTGKILFGADNQDRFATEFRTEKDVGQKASCNYESIMVAAVDEEYWSVGLGEFDLFLNYFIKYVFYKHILYLSSYIWNTYPWVIVLPDVPNALCTT